MKEPIKRWLCVSRILVAIQYIFSKIVQSLNYSKTLFLLIIIIFNHKKSSLWTALSLSLVLFSIENIVTQVTACNKN